ncbi:MAG: hypothetical protein ACOCQX_04495 [Candidatus Nanoarchaeia archaeon]
MVMRMKKSKTDKRMFMDIQNPDEEENKKWKKTEKWRPWDTY